MKYKAIIVDDEAKLREVMSIKIEQYCPEIVVIDKLSNASDAYEAIIENKPDIVFLDIAMPGESGFDLLERFDDIGFEIIFATGFNEYALDALKVSAVDYILKPIKTEDLTNAVSKAIKNIVNRQKIEKYEVLKHNINHVGDQNAKVAIPGSNSYDFVKISEIIRCEGWQKYTKIYLKDGACIVSSYNIGVYKDMLENYEFYACHKSHLINKRLIDRYLKEGIVVMSDGSNIPVSRRKKEDFMEKVVRQF